jgi:hypothetical protein
MALSTFLSLSAFFLVSVTGEAAALPGRLIEITGDYRYAALSTERPDDTKALTCREAWRLAVANSSLYREQTAGFIDSPGLRNLAYNLADSFVQDGKVIEQTTQGRAVFCQVRGFLPVEETTRAIRATLASGPTSGERVDQNHVLRLLDVREEGSHTIAIQYQVLKRLDWIGTQYQGGFREWADIMVDFFDDRGLLVRSDRFPAHRTSVGDDVMNPGAVGILKVPRPPGAKTYRVWLIK